MTRTSSKTREYSGSRAPMGTRQGASFPATRTPGASILLPTVIRSVFSSTDSDELADEIAGERPAETLVRADGQEDPGGRLRGAEVRVLPLVGARDAAPLPSGP